MRYFLLPKMDGNEIETPIQSLRLTHRIEIARWALFRGTPVFLW